MILMIDNYDSFVFNLYQYIGTINPNISVVRNNEITLEEITALNPTHIVISPGPGRPSDAGICEEVIRTFAPRTPVLGVCLGHQALCEAFGTTITYAKTLMHGKSSTVTLNHDDPLFAGLPDTINVARYHSLAVDPATLPPELQTTAVVDGEVMAVMHTEYPLHGLQFHPESILTPDGMKLLENFLAL